MVFGNLVALVQQSVKRMLAYSAIAHTGYLLVGIVAAGDSSALESRAGASVVFYLFAYALVTIGAFTALSYFGEGRETFESYRGLGRKDPLASLAVLVLMFSFVGIPPTAGFWGKLYVFREALAAGHWVLALAGILTSVVSVYYYLRLVVSLYLEPASSEDQGPPPGTTASGLAIAVAVAAVVLVGLFPERIFRISLWCFAP